MNGPDFNSLIAWRAASMPGNVTVKAAVYREAIDRIYRGGPVPKVAP